MTDLTPVTLEPVLLPKVWGGDRLGLRGLAVPADSHIGEAWMVADMASTSPTGAGGQAVISRVLDGPHAGRSLADLARRWTDQLLGQAYVAGAPVPMLVKLLDAREHLSVQVHPSPRYAAAHAGAHLKTECWYVLSAAPDALLYLGTRPGVTHDQLRAAAVVGSIAELLVPVVPVPGSCYLLPSGLIHALGAGVVVAEIQTPSDTTFRLYDWTNEYGRAPRALHLDESLAACDLAARAIVRSRGAHESRAVVAETPFFTVEELRLTPPESVQLSAGDAAACVVLLLDGAAELQDAADAWPTVRCGPSAAVFVPAALAGTACLAASGREVRALVVRLGARA